MVKGKLEESWLTEKAKQALEPAWREQVLKILLDISTLPHLRYTYVIGRDGSRFTRYFAPDRSPTKGEPYSTQTFHRLAIIVEQYLRNIEFSEPSHLSIELEDEILTIAPCGEIFLIASFSHGVPRGYMGMKLTKRLTYLRSLWQSDHIEERAFR